MAAEPQPAAGVIAILGAGALGRLWAGYLPEEQVAFIRRPGSGEASDFAPLSYGLELPDGSRRQLTVPWVDTRHTRPELLLVTTKAGDTLDALQGPMTHLGPAVPLVLFQNGMGSQQAVAERWPQQPVLAASTTEGANRPAPALTVHAGRGQTWLGPLTQSGSHCLAHVTNRLRASGLEVQPENDIKPRLWQKLVINAGINPFTAILDCANGDILQHPFYLAHIDDLCGEIRQLLAAEQQQPGSIARIREQIEAVARRTAGNTSSMRGDVQRGRTTEIDFINGYIAWKGESLGLPMPVNQMLTRRVKQLSAPHHT